MLLGSLKTQYVTGGDFELLTLFVSTTGMLGPHLCTVTLTSCNADNQTQGSYVLDKHCTELHFPPILLDICMYVCMCLCIYV